MKERFPFSRNKKLTVVQFFGGPGIGKSTAAPELFALMNKAGLKVELVGEFAKDMMWENRNHVMPEQDYIFAEQHRRIRRLVDHDIDYAVVDSSILLSLFYMPDDFPQSFRQFVRDVYDSYDNVNILLDRNPNIPYIQTGRNETLEQAKEIDASIKQYFIDTNTPFHSVMAGDEVAKHVLALLKAND